MASENCSICRRVGVKLFLKGERCSTQKCAMIKRPFPPGPKPKKSRRGGSEFSKELREKQKLRNWYNLREKQFKKYVTSALAKRGQVDDAGVLLIKKFASRLDNVVFRLGFASSRTQARQLVNHGHFLVNGKRTSIPSYSVKKGDVISLSPISQKKAAFKNTKEILKKYKAPAWLLLDPEKLEGKVASEPTIEELSLPIEMSTIFEFYSR